MNNDLHDLYGDESEEDILAERPTAATKAPTATTKAPTVATKAPAAKSLKATESLKPPKSVNGSTSHTSAISSELLGSVAFSHSERSGSGVGLKESLRLEEYQGYYDAIICNDEEYIKDLFRKATLVETELLINSEFHFQYTELDFARMKGRSKININSKQYKITKPFHLCVAYATIEIIQLLLTVGADVLQCDSTGHNAIHTLVSAARHNPDEESRLCLIYEWLRASTNAEDFTNLMLTENYQGLRPLEYAMQQDCLELFNAFLLTPAVYVVKDEIIGMTSYKWIDITEYEGGSRHDRSPMSLLANMDISKHNNEKTHEFMSSPIVTSWINAKIYCNTPIMAVWFLSRLLVIILFIIFDRDSTWQEQEITAIDQVQVEALCPEARKLPLDMQFKFGLGAFLLVAAVISLVYDYIDLVAYFSKTYRFRKTDIEKQKTVRSGGFIYRAAHHLFSYTVVTVIPLVFYFNSPVKFIDGGLLIDGAHSYVHFARATLPLSVLWSLLGFARLIPWLSTAVMSIQSMLGELAHLFVLYVLVTLPFINSFFMLTAYNIKEACIGDFETTLETVYSLFRLMLTQLDLSQEDLLGRTWMIYIMHLCYVFLVLVLLVNFVISVMPTSYMDKKSTAIVSTLSRLNLAVTVEDKWYLFAEK